jgi:parallel beta-helix repeat protein
LITGSENTNIHRVTFEGNKIAVFMTGSIGSTIEQNFIGPNTIGVASHSSTGAQIHANMMTGNDLAGVTLVNTDRSQLKNNCFVSQPSGGCNPQ